MDQLVPGKDLIRGLEVRLVFCIGGITKSWTERLPFPKKSVFYSCPCPIDRSTNSSRYFQFKKPSVVWLKVAPTFSWFCPCVFACVLVSVSLACVCVVCKKNVHQLLIELRKIRYTEPWFALRGEGGMGQLFERRKNGSLIKKGRKNVEEKWKMQK